MSRPKLEPTLSAHDFLDYYWLKNELLIFCRKNTLATSGSKTELTKRIAHFLDTGERLKPVKVRKASKMPTNFHKDTVIEKGWRSSQALRAFFKKEIGSHFHFNAVMREFIKYEAGKTLGNAIKAWEENQNTPREKDIAPQFEYNRHMRAYFGKYPQATRQEALAAWQQKRSRRKSEH